MAEPTGRLVRPKPLPTAFAVLGFAILMALGVWQLARLDWKTDLIERVESRLNREPAALPASLDAAAAENWTWRPVRAQGRFLYDETLYWQGRTRGGDAGVRALTPLKRPNRATVFVDRGWLPYDRQGKIDGDRAAGQRVTVTGVVRPQRGPGWFTPDNKPAQNRWYWLDVPAMAQAAGLNGKVLPLVIQQRPGSPATTEAFPKPTPVKPHFRNQHLQYAITWFALAAGLVAVFFFSQCRRPERDDA